MVALFVIGTFLTFLIIDFFVKRSSEKSSTQSQAVPISQKFLIPRGYFFNPRHSWVELLSNGMARVGIDDFSQKVIGTIDKASPVSLNSVVKKGEPMMTISQGERTMTFTAPLTGKVVEINESIQETPGILNTDPYIAGWVAVIEPENLGSEIKSFTLADEAAQWLRQEISRFREFINIRSPQLALAGRTMLDGGVPLTGTLKDAPDSDWKAFEEEFLKETR
jgi:glycine cleavage system H protein